VAGLVLVLFLISIVVFLMVAAVPGDPVEHMTGVHVPPEVVEALRSQYGLDRPVLIRYGMWLKHILLGDLGVTVAGRLRVSSLIAQALPVSLELTALAVLISIAVALPIGVSAAIWANSAWDKAIMFAGIALGSIPGYILGLLLLLLFSYELRILPAGGYVPFAVDPLGNLRHMAMPSFGMGVYFAGGLMRFIRSGMLEVLGKDYIRTARAKGIPDRKVNLKHALRNALVPITTFLGLQLGEALGGAIITEVVFVLPGLGLLGLRAILSREFVLIQGAVLVIAVWYTMCNLLVDILVILINPRTRYT